jgi:hypothetical protein
MMLYVTIVVSPRISFVITHTDNVSVCFKNVTHFMYALLRPVSLKRVHNEKRQNVSLLMVRVMRVSSEIIST